MDEMHSITGTFSDHDNDRVSHLRVIYTQFTLFKGTSQYCCSNSGNEVYLLRSYPSLFIQKKFKKKKGEIQIINRLSIIDYILWWF